MGLGTVGFQESDANGLLRTWMLVFVRTRTLVFLGFGLVRFSRILDSCFLGYWIRVFKDMGLAFSRM